MLEGRVPLAGPAFNAFFVVSTLAGAQTIPSIAVGFEQHADRFTYRFENPSSFGTPELVPHFFRQHYAAEPRWLMVHAASAPAPRVGRWQATAGFTPEATATGDDYDTFVQPDGDIVVSGTSGNVSMRSWRAEGSVDIASRPAGRMYVGYGFRRDRSNFHAGNKTVTHTRPPSVEASVVTTRETTISNVTSLRLGGDAALMRGRWTLRWAAEAEPTTLARLTVLLPDKYPGRELVFSAAAVTGSTSLSIERPVGPLAINARVGYGRAWGYRKAASFARQMTVLAVNAAWRLSP